MKDIAYFAPQKPWRDIKLTVGKPSGARLRVIDDHGNMGCHVSSIDCEDLHAVVKTFFDFNTPVFVYARVGDERDIHWHTAPGRFTSRSLLSSDGILLNEVPELADEIHAVVTTLHYGRELGLSVEQLTSLGAFHLRTQV